MSETPQPDMEQLPQRVNANERLISRGRFVDTTFLVEIGDTPYLIVVSAGRITGVKRGPFDLMPSWTFALRASRESWEQFWLPVPPPGFHDLFAMVKKRLLRVEGELHPFMANLLYFKGVMAALRPPVKEGL